MNCPEICPCMEVYLDDKSFAQNHTDFRFLFRSSPVHSDPNISSIFFSAVSMDSSSNKSYPMPASSLPTAPFFLTNSSSSSYRDLSLVLGIQRKEKTAPTREVAADRNITPLMPRLLTRTGNAYNGETYLFIYPSITVTLTFICASTNVVRDIWDIATPRLLFFCVKIDDMRMKDAGPTPRP